MSERLPQASPIGGAFKRRWPHAEPVCTAYRWDARTVPGAARQVSVRAVPPIASDRRLGLDSGCGATDGVAGGSRLLVEPRIFGGRGLTVLLRLEDAAANRQRREARRSRRLSSATISSGSAGVAKAWRSVAPIASVGRGRVTSLPPCCLIDINPAIMQQQRATDGFVSSRQSRGWHEKGRSCPKSTS